MSDMKTTRPVCAFPNCMNPAKPYKKRNGERAYRKYCNRHVTAKGRAADIAQLPTQIKISNEQTTGTKRAAVSASILKFIESGCGVYAACESVGLSYGSFLRWRREDPTLEESVQLSIASSYERDTDLVEKALFAQAKDCEGPPSAKFYVLGNRRAENWRDVRKMELSGNKTNPIEISVVNYASKDKDAAERPDTEDKDTASV